MARQYPTRERVRLVCLAIGIVLGAAGCSAGRIPEGARELPPGPDGQQRFELAKLPPDAPKLVKRVKNESLKIEVGFPEGWEFKGEYKDKDAPEKILLTKPSANPKSSTEHEIIVRCWNGVSDVRTLRDKTVATIKGAPALKPLSEQTGPVRNVILGEGKPAPFGPVWVVSEMGGPAEVHTLRAFHDAGFQTYSAQGELTGKFATRYHRTIYVIVKAAPKPGGCNYGITLREYSGGQGFEEKLAGDALAIAAALR